MTALPIARPYRRPALLLGALITLALAAVALLSLFWTPYPAADINIAARLQGPSARHWLGTDQFGRDVLSMLMAGSRNSFAVGFVAVGIGLTLGVALGLLAAARGGIVDEAVMRLADFTFAFPAVLSAIMITAWLGPGAVNAIIAIGIFNIPVFARLARGSAMQVLSRDFILAARAAGKGTTRIVVEHVLPNIAGILIVQGTIQFALAILAEAGLAYLGLGTQPPNPSWGKMLNEAQTFLHRSAWLAIFPGAAIAIAVLGFNLLGDGLRDLIDPRLRHVRR
jgi:peptide/nickel transport system permease protein